MQMIETMSKQLGHQIGTTEEWAFPQRKELLDDVVAGCEKLSKCALGYRLEYIVDAVQRAPDGWEFVGLESPEVERMLMELHGVGQKVAACTSLQGLGRLDAFPIDTWVKKGLEYLGWEGSITKLKEHALEHYGNYGGYAQQYIFHYMREHR